MKKTWLLGIVGAALIGAGACPGGSAAPCDSLVKMPVTSTGIEPPVAGPPFLHPVADDASPDWVDGVDTDGNYLLSWDAPASPATAVCTYLIEEGTSFGTVFTDDAEECRGSPPTGGSGSRCARLAMSSTS
jgi:hypothetical protein